MRCTSPLYRLTNADLVPHWLKRTIYGYKEFNHFVNNCGVNPLAFTRLNCGQCLSCRINKAREWAERCYLEAQEYESNYFITLTYDDEHLPITKEGVPTLKKRDLQLFWKRLRIWCKRNGKPSPRYFATGEYGDETFRPHYHVILFNIKFDDLTLYKTVKRGNDVYAYLNSDVLHKLWGKGFAVVCNCVPETCIYTARYSLKKVGMRYNESYARDILEDICSTDEQRFNALCSIGYIQKPFNVQSNRPGIGGAFCDANLDSLLATDMIPGVKVKHIRYFDKIMERVDEKRVDMLKELRLQNVEQCERYNDRDFEIRDNYVNATQKKKRLSL